MLGLILGSRNDSSKAFIRRFPLLASQANFFILSALNNNEYYRIIVSKRRKRKKERKKAPALLWALIAFVSWIIVICLLRKQENLQHAQDKRTNIQKSPWMIRKNFWPLNLRTLLSHYLSAVCTRAAMFLLLVYVCPPLSAGWPLCLCCCDV